MKFNSREEKYKVPFGAVPEGTEIILNIESRVSEGLYNPGLLVFRDGSYVGEDYPLELVSRSGASETWRISFKAGETGLYWYGFYSVEGTQRRDLSNEKGQTRWQLTVYDRDFSTPDWFYGGIMYQIFPDRFYRSEAYTPLLRPDSKERRDWGGLPERVVLEGGRIPNNDFFCGNLAGITEKLDYLESLGVTCIYLNPIFEAVSNHRYDTGDYEKIDPVLGTEEDFVKLCQSAAKRGIRIILDGVFSHTGSDSRYFNKEGRYPETGAFQSESSDYYPWYKFEKWPDSYASWWGVDILPEVREEEPSYLNYITGSGGILEKWLKAGASGWRLDVADELPDVFLDSLRSEVKEARNDALIIGEVWEDASNKVSYGYRRRYLQGKQLDSVMNYVFKDAVFALMADGNVRHFGDRIEEVLENYPKPAVDCLMNILGTHDTERALTALGSKEKFKAATLINYFLPGVPCVFYGDEAGLEGKGDPWCRGCYPWENEDGDLLDYFRLLGKIRLDNREILGSGDFKILLTEGGILSYKRISEAGELTVVVNVSAEEKSSVSISEPGDECRGSEEWKTDLITGQRAGSFMKLGSYEGAVFVRKQEDWI